MRSAAARIRTFQLRARAAEAAEVAVVAAEDRQTQTCDEVQRIPARSPQSRLTAIVSGMISAVPSQGGATWAVLQYILGLEDLGHRVVFIDPVGPANLKPEGADLKSSENARYFSRVMRDYGLSGKSALLLSGTRQTVGLTYKELVQTASQADLLLNLSGVLGDRDLIEPVPLRVYLDLDPGFTQLWRAAQDIDMRFDGHNRFVTVGWSLGDGSCTLPSCGVTWIPTLQPVVLRHWRPGERIEVDGFTTVGNWRSYGSVDFRGVFYGQKAHAWRSFISLPSLSRRPFFPALAIHPDEKEDLQALASNGWRLLDPRLLTSTPELYRQFIRGSKSEFAVAKSGYVLSRCGWFSERSACYLAAGRPVLAQDTGFSRYLPTGKGLLSFATLEEAVEGVARIERDYALHRRAARRLAEECFDSRKVLGRLLAKTGVHP